MFCVSLKPPPPSYRNREMKLFRLFFAHPRPDESSWFEGKVCFFPILSIFEFQTILFHIFFPRMTVLLFFFLFFMKIDVCPGFIPPPVLARRQGYCMRVAAIILSFASQTPQFVYFWKFKNVHHALIIGLFKTSFFNKNLEGGGQRCGRVAASSQICDQVIIFVLGKNFIFVITWDPTLQLPQWVSANILRTSSNSVFPPSFPSCPGSTWHTGISWAMGNRWVHIFWHHKNSKTWFEIRTADALQVHSTDLESMVSVAARGCHVHHSRLNLTARRQKPLRVYPVSPLLFLACDAPPPANGNPELKEYSESPSNSGGATSGNVLKYLLTPRLGYVLFRFLQSFFVAKICFRKNYFFCWKRWFRNECFQGFLPKVFLAQQTSEAPPWRPWLHMSPSPLWDGSRAPQSGTPVDGALWEQVGGGGVEVDQWKEQRFFSQKAQQSRNCGPPNCVPTKTLFRQKIGPSQLVLFLGKFFLSLFFWLPLSRKGKRALYLVVKIRTFHLGVKGETTFALRCFGQHLPFGRIVCWGGHFPHRHSSGDRAWTTLPHPPYLITLIYSSSPFINDWVGDFFPQGGGGTFFFAFCPISPHI